MNNMRRKHVGFPSRQREIHPTKSTIPAPNTGRKRPFVCPTAGGLVDHDRHMLPGCWRADLIRQGRQVMKPTGLDWIYWDVSPFFPRKFGRNISCVCQNNTEKHVWGFRQPGSRTKALPPKTIPDLTAWIPWGKVKIIITAVDRYKPLQLDLYVDYTL